MAFFRGTATDYLDLLDQLEQLATSDNHLESATIDAGGSGYAIGDILELDGGTGTHPAQVEVTGESSGVVTSVRVWSAGAYSAPPSDPVSTTAVTGAGTGCDLNCVFADTGWTTMRSQSNLYLLTAQLLAAGTGYSASDVLTISGGTGTAATLTVLTVGGSGEVLTFEITTRGDYTVTPGASVSVTGGGSGATFTCTYAGTVDRQELILRGSGAGFQEIYVGMRSFYNSGTDASNWDLAGMTGFDASLSFLNQAGISPGKFETSASGGAVLTLAQTSITYWMAITPSRIWITAAIGGNYLSCYMGFVSPFGTQLEFPYPLVIMGCTSDFTQRYSSTQKTLSSPVDPIQASSGNFGPGVVRLPTGMWKPIFNEIGSTAAFEMVVYPAGKPVNSNLPSSTIVLDVDEVVDEGSIPWQAIIPNSGTPGSQTARLIRTPDSGGAISLIVPATIINTSIDSQTHIVGQGIIGELDGIYWTTSEGGIVSEDTVTIDGVVYRIFKSGSRADLWTFLAVREN